MAFEYMLRDYRVKPGEMEEWLREWATKVYPLRLKFGFKVVGAWKVEEDRFVWILGYDGKKGDFERANEKYYNSKERKAMKPDPARHLSEIKHWMMSDAMQGV
ncbi:MAG: NIPSNAP family protein [Nitrososphaerota archaeon]|nr:NIPSNAP family protein [Nitrososphaerota archaeon]